MKKILLPFLTLVLIACSSAPSVSQDDYCPAVTEKYARCNPKEDVPSSYGSACASSYQCIAGAYEASFVEAAFDCQLGESCISFKECTRLALSKADRSAEESDKCVARYTQCKDDKGFDDDVCPQLRILKLETATAIVECLAKPCDQIKDCISGVAQNRGIKCDALD